MSARLESRKGFQAGLQAGRGGRIENSSAAPGKRLSVPARYWWLRSPNPWNANNVRNVNPSGALNNNNASNGYGLAAACFNGPSFE